MIVALFKIIILIIISIIPVLLWLELISNNNKNEKKILLLIFLCGIVSVIPLTIFLIAWEKYKIIDLITINYTRISNDTALIIYFAFMFYGAAEEIVKHFVVRYVDSNLIEINSVSDSIKYSVAAALGFAFFENIMYLYSALQNQSSIVIFITYIFRSTVTMCGHIVFSSIFGYFYGTAKFSKTILTVNTYLGKYKWFIKISDALDIDAVFAFKKLRVLQGLMISMTYHAIFNFLINLDSKIASVSVVLFIIAGFVGIESLINRNSKKVIFTLDASQLKHLSKKEEKVIMEVISSEYKEGNYKKIIEICNRALSKDPNNNIFRLFKAKAEENL